MRPALVVWTAYAAIDLAIGVAAVLVAGGMSLEDGTSAIVLVVISLATKLAAVLFGARTRLARPAESTAAPDTGRT
jgi:hypothetical protein